MSTEELKRFYKARVKKPDLFTYDNDGNLVELSKEGSIIKTIPLPDYRPPTFEEFDEMEQKRIETIALANKEYENSLKELRNALSNPEISDSEILRINRKVKEADINLEAARFPLMHVNREDGISINQIDFDKLYEKRKYPYSFYFLEERPYSLQEQYVRIGKIAQKPMISVAEIKAARDSANTSIVILFADPDTNDYGFLSLKWVVEIEFNNTMYNSAHQAIAAEIAKSFNDQENLQKIMTAETPDEINYKLEDVPGDADTNEVKWNDLTKQLINDINLHKFEQYPELAGRLLETKNATLGAYLPDDNLIGIGLSLDNIQSKNPINWTGQNLLGKALMNIRDKIRLDREIKSTEQQAIINSQPIPRRKKPSVASSVVTQQKDETNPMPVIPRSIRRKPQQEQLTNSILTDTITEE
jgi:ribA/ribD-fused uncharacterized protein